MHKKYLGQDEKAHTVPVQAPQQSYLSDTDIITKIEGSKQADKFHSLYNIGQLSGDHSADDMALCSILAFWTGCDASQMDRIFRSSALMRDKWDRKQVGTTYGAITIQKAIENCKEVYDPEHNKPKPKDDFKVEVKQEQHGKNLILTNNGNIQKRWENVDAILTSKNINVRYNEMTKELEFTGVQSNKDMMDATFTRIGSILLDNGLSLSKDRLYDYVYCMGSQNRYNPIADYLMYCKSLTSATIDEVRKLYDTLYYQTADPDRVKFYNTMLLKWLLNCANIAFNTLDEQRTFEFALLFKGKQGIGKSKWIRSIIPNDMFIGDVILDLNDKDMKSEVLQKWIVELGEISGTFRKSDLNKLKAFITSYKDTWRNPYGRNSNTYPRRTGFFGTVNDEKFLVDKTGNRRFVVLPIEKLDYRHYVKRDVMWGEIMHLLDNYNEVIYMTPEDQRINEMYNEDYVLATDTELALDDAFNWNSTEIGALTLTMIAELLKSKTGKVYSENAIRSALNHKGYYSERFYAGKENHKVRGRYYKLPFIDGLSLPF